MRHHNSTRKFGRKKNQKHALMHSLARNLIIREKMKTTEAKAKELRPYMEKLVTRAKKGDLATRRAIIGKLANATKETKKLMDVIAPRYKDTKGGYLRIIKLPVRKSDSAKMAQIEFV